MYYHNKSEHLHYYYIILYSRKSSTYSTFFPFILLIWAQCYTKHVYYVSVFDFPNKLNIFDRFWRHCASTNQKYNVTRVHFIIFSSGFTSEYNLRNGNECSITTSIIVLCSVRSAFNLCSEQ